MERLASMLDTRSPPLVCLQLKILGLFVSVEVPWSQTPVVKLKTLSKCQRWSKSSDLVHIYVFISETFPWCFNAGSIDWFLKQKSFNGFSLLKKNDISYYMQVSKLLHCNQGKYEQSWLYGSEAKDNRQSLKGYYQYDSDHETLLALPCTRT